MEGVTKEKYDCEVPEQSASVTFTGDCDARPRPSSTAAIMIGNNNTTATITTHPAANDNDTPASYC
jgi:hypothetical protein